MNLRQRLLRLEKLKPPPRAEPEVDFFVRARRLALYLSGKGPKPPEWQCPAGSDPEEWASEIRTREYSLTDRTPPGITDEEKARGEATRRVFHRLRKELSERAAGRNPNAYPSLEQ